MKYQLLLLVVALTSSLGITPKRYDNFKVYRVLPTNEAQLNALRVLPRTGQYSFWTDASSVNRFVDVMVAPNLKYHFENYLQDLNIHGKVLIEDVQELINNEQNYTMARSPRFNWQSYQTLDQINDWLYSLETSFPGVVNVIVGGQSYEGREILGVRVSFGPGNKAVFIEGGIHAREWISHATVTYMLNELLTSSDPNVRAVAESRDWYVFPSVNPDGYVYTQTDRMWRKTTKPNPDGCIGTDPNRNWGYHWMEGGASDWGCLEDYAGPAAFSEIETRTLSQFINTIASNLESYLAFHSFSQLILIPFGHEGLEVLDNNEELHTIGYRAAEKLAERYGTQYGVGTIPEAIYVASGGSGDWVVGVHRNVRLPYTFELRDTGRYGFILPADQIIPTGEETLDAVISIFQQVDGTA